MFHQKQEWTGFLLCLIVISQYVHVAGRMHFHTNQNDVKEICVRSFETEDTCPLTKPKEKRIVIAILFAISIFATLANLAFDLYLQIEGCCGLFPDACKYRKEFNEIKDDLKVRIDRMNDEYTVCKNSLEYIRATNQNNGDIWQELLRIMVLQTRVITTLDSQVLNKYRNESTKIKNALRKHNRTVEMWTDADLSTAYNGAFQDVQTAAISLAPIVGILGFQAIKSGITWYKSYKIAQTVKANAHLLSTSAKASKVLGASSVQGFTKATVTAQTKSLTAVSTASKFAKFAGAAMSVIAIGFEIYMAIQKVERCRDVRNACKDARDKIKPEQAAFKVTETHLKEFERNLTKSYKEVRSQIISEIFLNHTVVLKSLAQGADVQTDSLKKASRDIQSFHDAIKTANRDNTVKLQQKLIASMRNIEYTWDCFDRKVSTVSYVYEHCKRGSNSMKWLFDNGVKSFLAISYKCTSSTNHAYITFAATEKYVGDRVVREGFLKDCVLNNEDVKMLVCSRYAQDYSLEENASQNDLSVNQVQYIISKCPPAPVSPLLKTIICAEKVKNNLDQTKATYHKYDQNEVTTIYNACPTPELPIVIKDEICIYKNAHFSEAEIVKKYSQYRGQLIRNCFKSCPIKISAVSKRSICTAKAYNVLLADVIKLMKHQYPESAIEKVYNACPSAPSR